MTLTYDFHLFAHNIMLPIEYGLILYAITVIAQVPIEGTVLSDIELKFCGSIINSDQL